MQAWAGAVAAGVDDDLFWDTTPTETALVLREIEKREMEREKSAILRAGLITAATYNVHRKKGARALQPKDFIREPTRVLTPDQMEKVLDRWASRSNGLVEA